MDPPYSNFFLNLGDSGDYSNTQYYQNSSFLSNSSQVHVTENLGISQNTEKQPRGTKWDVAEDIALMSAWCEASENSILGKKQKSLNLWARIKSIYDVAQAENPEKIGMRNVEQMKGRYKRLNESVQKWVGVYQEACRQTRSGMSQNVSYNVNGHEYNMTYYLTDGIYPSWAAFVKSITCPQLKHQMLATL